MHPVSPANAPRIIIIIIYDIPKTNDEPGAYNDVKTDEICDDQRVGDIIHSTVV